MNEYEPFQKIKKIYKKIRTCEKKFLFVDSYFYIFSKFANFNCGIMIRIGGVFAQL